MQITVIASGAAHVVHAFTRAAAVISMAATLVVMGIVVYGVVLREAGEPPVRGVVEYVELGMVLLAFFALAETERRRQHVGVDEILAKLSGRTYTIVRIGAAVACAFVTVILAYTAGEVLQSSLERGEYKVGLVQVPMWPARVAVFVGFTLLALEQVISAVEDVLDHLKRAPAGGDPVKP